MAVSPAEFENVSKDYQSGWRRRVSITALREVTLAIEPGEILGLLGPNRAGKTTLVKLLLSLSAPSSGHVRRFGRSLSDRSTLGRIGYVHENHAFPRYLTAAGLLEYYAALSFVPFETARERVPKLLELVGLADRGRESISGFSKGMIQRLGVAQALLNDPELLVLDEPTEGLDLSGRQLLRRLVRDLKAQGRTVLLISHVLTEVEQLCDRAAVLVDGRLVFTGTMDALKRRSSRTTPSLESSLQSLYNPSQS